MNIKVSWDRKHYYYYIIYVAYIPSTFPSHQSRYSLCFFGNGITERKIMFYWIVPFPNLMKGSIFFFHLGKGCNYSRELEKVRYNYERPMVPQIVVYNGFKVSNFKQRISSGHLWEASTKYFRSPMITTGEKIMCPIVKKT